MKLFPPPQLKHLSNDGSLSLPKGRFTGIMHNMNNMFPFLLPFITALRNFFLGDMLDGDENPDTPWCNCSMIGWQGDKQLHDAPLIWRIKRCGQAVGAAHTKPNFRYWILPMETLCSVEPPVAHASIIIAFEKLFLTATYWNKENILYSIEYTCIYKWIEYSFIALITFIYE